MSEEARTQQSNPWKTATIAIVASVVAALASGVVVARVTDAKQSRIDAERLEAEAEEATLAEEEAKDEAAPVVIVQQPAATKRTVVLEDCNKYLAAADRKGREVAKDSVLGAAVGAGLGAAGGAIVDGGSGAGKGAGVGAIVGLAGGTLYGLNQENQRTQAARNAYHACKARQS